MAQNQNKQKSKYNLPRHLIIGQKGEELATKFLKQKNYQILARNFRYKKNEIDIIAFDPKFQVVIFVEVKTRSSQFYGHPSESVTPSKINRLIKAAYAFLRQNKIKKDFRFDIISILPNKIDHFENITMS